MKTPPRPSMPSDRHACPERRSTSRMWFLYVFAAVAGAFNALQSGANATLSKQLGQPFAAALVVTLTSSGVLLLAGVVSGRFGWPSLEAVREAPWWAWIGGAFGAVLLLSQLYVAQAIGAGPFIGIIVVAGALASLLLDHFGLMGFKVHSLNAWRIAGALLMAGGVALVAIF